MADVVARQYTPAFIFLYPQNPLVRDTISVVASSTTPSILLTARDVFVYREEHVVVPVADVLQLKLASLTPVVAISVAAEEITVPRRLHRSAWQARLGNRLDPIKRKLLDNSILLTAHPTDMLRIRVDRDPRTHDILSRRIIANEVIPIVLPTMTDVPLRHMLRDDRDVISFAMADAEDSKPFVAYCPLSGQLRRDDLLFRFIKDPHSDLPYAMVLQVKDELGTLAYSSLLYVKYSLTFYDESLPQEVVNAVYAATLKRERLQW